MKYTECDIVFVKPIKKEGLVVAVALDLETHSEKYFVHIEYGKDVICRDEDLELISTLEKEIEKVEERMKSFYEDESSRGYVDRHECDLECYITGMRNIETLKYSYAIYVENDELYAYVSFNEDSILSDKDLRILKRLIGEELKKRKNKK